MNPDVTTEELDRLRADVDGQLDLDSPEWEWQRAARCVELDGDQAGEGA